MKTFILFLLGWTLSLQGIEMAHMKDPMLIPNELTMLDFLITATEESLNNQKMLREEIKKYQVALKAFLKNSDNNDLLYQLVKVAYKTNEEIKKNHLTHNFNPEFISDLNFFSEIAKKNNIPIP